MQPGSSAAWPGHLLACGSQVLRKQVGLGHRGTGLDWTSYNLLACRTDVSSGRTEAGMRRLNSPQSWPFKVAAALRKVGSAWHPCWSSRSSAAATMRCCPAAAKTLASSDCGGTSYLECRRGRAALHCIPLPEYLHSFSLYQSRDAATLYVRIFYIRAEACLA